MLSAEQIAAEIVLAQNSNAYHVDLAVKYLNNGDVKKFNCEMEYVANCQNILYVLTMFNVNDCLTDAQQIALWNILHGLVQDCPNQDVDLNYILWQDFGTGILWQS